ncbi:MAG TPA: hypothetical protein VHM28_09460 [Anaerolineales bacterium]|jgi:hypothetical protein|nr:hypothetical protein [Anaerolineales bacterium]
MYRKSSSPIVLAGLVLILVSLACSASAPSTPTATSIPVTPTATKRPTSTPRPTPTPNFARTQEVEAREVDLQSYLDKGYISTTEGKFTELEDFKEEWAQINWYKWWTFDGNYSNLVFKGHFKWSTASTTPELSGCGIIFGLQANRDHYAVFLDKSRILFLMTRGGNPYSVGKTRGSGRANFSLPAEADVAVIVNGQMAYVSVNGDFTEYTLSADQTSAGRFAFTLLSGTNKDYGTRCEITNAYVWSPNP